ncbi:unnamed protein product, partial [Closterium sp. NIES-54]
ASSADQERGRKASYLSHPPHPRLTLAHPPPHCLLRILSPPVQSPPPPPPPPPSSSSSASSRSSSPSSPSRLSYSPRDSDDAKRKGRVREKRKGQSRSTFKGMKKGEKKGKVGKGGIAVEEKGGREKEQ